MPSAPVPEAAVNKCGDALPPENKVGPARKGLVPAPTGDAVGAQNRRQP